MKANRYNEMATADLTAELAKLKAKLFNLRFQHSAGQLKNTCELGNCKKDIARVKTVLRLRELNPALEPVKGAKKAK
ncbi:MAG: 50S ribosomal protein L29 [Clostridia bacterium]|nr:50S ribosomal protein L29 [Clostridia bacterium]